MPRLIPCSSSPPAGGRIRTNMSTISATAVSAWPTPTVSTNTASNPAASHSRIASRVRRATPPRLSPAEDGRIKASGARASSAMRVLSPRIAPPPRFEAGSTASTAIRRPSAMPSRPKRSIKVDLPAPGGPEMPMRTALPGFGQERLDQPLGLVAMVRPDRFDQGDGPRERPPVTPPQSPEQRCAGHPIRAGKKDPSPRLRRTHLAAVSARILSTISTRCCTRKGFSR